jgi:hypothetical protein
MKISEAQSTVAAHATASVATDQGATAPDRPTLALPVDRITTDEAVQFRTSVANGVSMAATERAMRLQSLSNAVSAGAYRPSVSRLADQILAQAELEARLAGLFR